MFRKMAIALVAASVFTAPVLAQNNTLSGGPTSTPSSDTMDKTKTEKTEKSAESTEKSAAKHHRIARHHRHGSKTTKLGKPAKYGKAHTTTSKFVKTESRRHGKILPKPAYGRASKHTSPEMKSH
jgi:hypothetical protein